ncbi:DUF2470 domain-containing protein [Mycoplasma tullyi]|uniref:DUF2470 domain-containing protein n=1 Tax=Mycoplasma tullyi TaxID=1612150 RepID=A0A7D7YKE2_9MOLU|nr:DUF2470 domain-containing protein [Mycoplasma tullyi]QMT98601.1 DUF2470 domain-containing protein [Mycoplasma tullyi]
MNKQDIIEHVNNDHLDTLNIIYRHYVKNEEIKSIKLIDLDLDKLTVLVNDQTVEIPYERKVKELSEIKYVMIEMHQKAQYLLNLNDVQEEYNEFFKSNFRSIHLATRNKDNELACSSTVLYRKGDRLYVYLAKVAKHYENIRFNNQNLGVLLIENSADDKSEYLRKTAQYLADFEQIDDQNLVNELLDNLAQNPVEARTANMLKKFVGFVLFEVKLKKGRVNLGFGKAYDVVDHKLVPIEMKEEHRMVD